MKKKENEEESEIIIKPLLYGDHKAPVTRRDFLAAGLMGMSTLAIAPSLLSSTAWAQSNCPGTAALMTGNVPFLASIVLEG